jgi:hypothetical protein
LLKAVLLIELFASLVKYMNQQCVIPVFGDISCEIEKTNSFYVTKKNDIGVFNIGAGAFLRDCFSND